MIKQFLPLACLAALSAHCLAQTPAPASAAAPASTAINPFAIGPDHAQPTTSAASAKPAKSDSLFASATPAAERRRAAETRRVAEELDSGNSFYDRFIADRISVGAVYSVTSMKKTHVPYDPTQEKNFLGNINNLDESDMDGIGVVVRLKLCPYFALQFENDLHFELGMWNIDNQSRDADFVAKGLTYEALLMLPIDSIRCTPYIGLGVTDLSCSIDYNNWWHWGWSSPADYETYGHGSTDPRNSTSRWMMVEDPSSAFTLSAGVTIKLWRYAELDFFYRTVQADDVPIAFKRGVRNARGTVRTGYIPVECSSFGGALRVVF